KSVKLVGTATSYVNAFLGLLPMRDDPGPGVEVRYVYPKSPADTAGLKAGDRVMKIGAAAAGVPKGPKGPKGPTLTPVQNRAALMAAAQRLPRGPEVTLEIKRKEKGGDKKKEKTMTVPAKLVAAPAALRDKLPLPSSAGKALGGHPKPKKDPKDPFPP